MKIKFPEQRDLIQGILDRSHLTVEEIARKLCVKPDTIRKYAAGYQAAGKQTLARFKDLELIETNKLESSAKQNTAASEHDEVVKYAGKLLNLPPEQRGLVTSMIDQLGAKKAAKKGTAKVTEPVLEKIRTEKKRLLAQPLDPNKPNPAASPSK